MNSNKVNLCLYFLFIIAIIFSYYFIDKPVTYFACDHNLRQYAVFNDFTYIVNFVEFSTFLAYLSIAIRYILKKTSQLDRKVLMIANSIAAAYLMKDVIKFIFGRAWPATWTNNNPSLLSNNVYGFHWLHGGASFGSFPSGHTTVMLAATTAIALTYPKARWLITLMIIASILVIIGLIGDYYHYVSDIIAGGLLGNFVTKFIVKSIN